MYTTESGLVQQPGLLDLPGLRNRTTFPGLITPRRDVQPSRKVVSLRKANSEMEKSMQCVVVGRRARESVGANFAGGCHIRCRYQRTYSLGDGEGPKWGRAWNESRDGQVPLPALLSYESSPCLPRARACIRVEQSVNNRRSTAENRRAVSNFTTDQELEARGKSTSASPR